MEWKTTNVFRTRGGSGSDESFINDGREDDRRKTSRTTKVPTFGCTIQVWRSHYSRQRRVGYVVFICFLFRSVKDKVSVWQLLFLDEFPQRHSNIVRFLSSTLLYIESSYSKWREEMPYDLGYSSLLEDLSCRHTQHPKMSRLRFWIQSSRSVNWIGRVEELVDIKTSLSSNRITD